MPKIIIYVNTGYHGANHKDEMEIDDQEWSAMSVKEKQTTLDDLAKDFLESSIEYGAYVEGEEND